MALTAFSLSMAVNTLVTGLIVFKILKVFLEVRLTSVEQALGTTGRGGTPLRHVIFVIIESGMALFAIQLIHFVFFSDDSVSPKAYNLSTVFNQMFIVIIKSVHFYYIFRFADNIIYLGHHANCDFGAGLNEIVLR